MEVLTILSSKCFVIRGVKFMGILNCGEKKEKGMEKMGKYTNN